MPGSANSATFDDFAHSATSNVSGRSYDVGGNDCVQVTDGAGSIRVVLDFPGSAARQVLQEVISMYESQFSLKRRPFAATPDPKCFLSSGLIQAALDELVVCVEQGQGVAIVSAPAGTGKTLLCERLQLELEPRFRVVFLRHASFMTRRALLQSILADLDHAYRRHDEQELRLELVPAIRALNPAREALVLICDEAHMLSEDLLEELRILSDLAENGRPLVRLVLVGQPALEETLASPGLEALNQRIRAHVCLESFDRAGSLDYIDYRITWAGGRTSDIFTPDSLDLICHFSEGVPRCINQLCDHSLLLAYVAEQTPVEVDTIREALQDLRQLPLHWNETILAERAPSESRSEAAHLHVDQITPTPGNAPEGIQSFEFGADVPEIESSISQADVDDGLEWDDAECECGDDCAPSESSSTLEIGDCDSRQESAPWNIMTQDPARAGREASLVQSTLRPGEVTEEIVWDRYVAIDGGFPIPQVVHSDTRTHGQVHTEFPHSADTSELLGTDMAAAPGKNDGSKVDSDGFEQVCARLDELLPESAEVPAWDRGGSEFCHPVSGNDDQNADDWDSLEAELGIAVCELTSEVHAELNVPQGGRAFRDLQDMLEIESPEGSSIEIGADIVSQPSAVNSSEDTRPAQISREATARPYRNLFSQLRRKQQGLL